MKNKSTVRTLIAGFSIALFTLLTTACGGGGGGNSGQTQQSAENQNEAATWDNFSWDDGSTWQ